VSMGGWAMDLHPADGVYSDLSGCTQWHSKGVYPIPYRTMYSRNVPNLFLGGRLISASHVAFGSTRVMATCAHNGQAVGMAAAVCIEKGLEPKALLREDCMHELQQRLLRRGQYIPGIRGEDEFDLARQATVTASSTMEICCLAADGSHLPLDVARALLLPVAKGPMPALTFTLDAKADTFLVAELWISSIAGNYTPDQFLESCELVIFRGQDRSAVLQFQAVMQRDEYVFVILRRNPDLVLHASGQRVTGLLALQQTMNAAVAKEAVQSPPEDIGVDSFEFWLPARRPKGKNPAITITPVLRAYSPGNVVNGFARPYLGTNAWVASAEDPVPRLNLKWEAKQRIKRLYLSFDTDFDHPMESVLMEHPERVIPFCVKSYRILDDAGVCLFTMLDNHQTKNEVVLADAAETRSLTIEVMETHGTPATIFEVRCFAE
jgi:FAD dependent oxidoreductase